MQNSVKMLGALIGCIWTLDDHVLTSGEPQNARNHPPSRFVGSNDSVPKLNQYEPFQHSKRLVKHSKWFAGHGSDDGAVPSLLTCSSIAGLTSTAFRGPASMSIGRFGPKIIVFRRISINSDPESSWVECSETKYDLFRSFPEVFGHICGDRNHETHQIQNLDSDDLTEFCTFWYGFGTIVLKNCCVIVNSDQVWSWVITRTEIKVDIESFDSSATIFSEKNLEIYKNCFSPWWK